MISEDWWDQALCKGTDDLHIWFASGPGKQALAICGNCSVVEPCLEEALRAEAMTGKGATFGVRGGMTAPQRKRIIRQRRKEQSRSEANDKDHNDSSM